MNKIDEEMEAFKAEQEKMMSHSDDEILEVKRGRPKIEKEKVIRTNIDASASMLAELDTIASEINIPRQSLIKILIQRGIVEHYREQELIHRVKKDETHRSAVVPAPVPRQR